MSTAASTRLSGGTPPTRQMDSTTTATPSRPLSSALPDRPGARVGDGRNPHSPRPGLTATGDGSREEQARAGSTTSTGRNQVTEPDQTTDPEADAAHEAAEASQDQEQAGADAAAEDQQPDPVQGHTQQ